MVNIEHKFESAVQENLILWQRTAYSMCACAELADDIVQDALADAWRNLHKLKSPDAMEAWIYRIVINTACSTLRREKRRRQVVTAVDPLTIAQNSYAHEEEKPPQFLDDMEKELQQHLSQLPPELSATLLLSVVEKKSTQEIAQIMGINAATVYWRIHKSRKLLKKAMAKKGVLL